MNALVTWIYSLIASITLVFVSCTCLLTTSNSFSILTGLFSSIAIPARSGCFVTLHITLSALQVLPQTMLQVATSLVPDQQERPLPSRKKQKGPGRNRGPVG